MKSHPSLFLALVACGMLAACTTPPAESKAPVAANADAKAEIQALFPKLKQGMSAAEVREKLGPPASITPLPSPDGHAETWIYYFQKNEGSTTVATGSVDISTFAVGSVMAGNANAPQLTYSNVAKKADVTLSLLMFNDHLAAQKAKVEHVLDYH